MLDTYNILHIVGCSKFIEAVENPFRVSEVRLLATASCS